MAEDGEAAAKMLKCTEDRYGGVEMEVDPRLREAGDEGRDPVQMLGEFGSAQSMAAINDFHAELNDAIESYKAAGKRGLWLKLELPYAAFVGAAVACGFAYHHAKPEYALLTRWLPESPSTLPSYAFTQIGVGGVVVNANGDVLLVQERISPVPAFQGSWKLPGGLADPGEDFADTVLREVREETGVSGTPLGVVSMRHTHGYRFGVGDLYVVVKILAEMMEITLDPHELAAAKWMSRSEMEAIVATKECKVLDGKISQNNWNVIANALEDNLVIGTKIDGFRPAMLYHAVPKTPGNAV